jgi:hypothetical protein
MSLQCAANDPIDVTATILDDHLEIIIHHSSDDPAHYVNHVTIKRGTETMFDKEFDAQTDTHSLDIQILHPPQTRKRIKKKARLWVEATCNQDGSFKHHVRVQ